MDHLPLPLHPTHAPLKISLLSTENYNGKDLASYRERQGWGTRTVKEWYDIFRSPTLKFRQFLERWILFGFLDNAFSKRINTADFVLEGTNSTCPVFTTKPLPALVQQFVDDADRTGEINCGIFVAVFVACRTHLALACSEPDRDEVSDPAILSRRENLMRFIELRMGSYKDPRSPEIVMAISAVMEAFLPALFRHGDLLERALKIQQVRLSPLWTSLIWTQLRGDGWCPSELTALFHRFNTSCLLFLHFLSRPGIHLSHRMINIHKGLEPTPDTSQHGPVVGLCTQLKCVHKQLNNNTYQTKHADGCSGCRDVVADADQLCKILKSGKIPLVLSIDEGDETETVTLVEEEPLLRLSNLVRSLQGDYSNIVLFWVDTICVPPDAAGLDEAQQLALSLMRRTYEDATTVLVLDSWLLSNTCTDKAHVETLLRIFSSTWNTRLWTYQEGALAKAIHFQFSDAAYDLDHGVEEFEASTELITDFTMARPLRERHHDIRGFRKLDIGIHDKLHAVAAALHDRTTSVASDEALCLAVLLNLDVSEIARTEPELRMQKFWRMLPTIPESIVFSSSPTLDVDGLRWAPRTFLRSPLDISENSGIGEGYSPTETTSVPATLISRGLIVRHSGLLFTSSTGVLPQNFYVSDEKKSWYEIALKLSGASGGIAYEYHEGESSKAFGISPWKTHRCQEAAFIRQADKGINFDDPLSAMIQRGEPGILVAVSRKRDGIIYCRKLCKATSRLMDWSLDYEDLAELSKAFAAGIDFYGAAYIDGTNETISLSIGMGKPPQQRWCIG